MTITQEQQHTWTIMYNALMERVEKYACKDYLRGLQLLELSDCIPTIRQLNQVVTRLTGWKIITSKEVYNESEEWFDQMLNKKFLVTDYLRGMDELAFSPRPDMFHDVFGHVVFMTMEEHAEIQSMFATAYVNVQESYQIYIERLAWFVTECGLIREEGMLKLYGGALITSAKEGQNVMDGNVPVLPFIGEEVMEYALPEPIYDDEDADKNVGENNTLFAFNSIEELKEDLNRTFSVLKKSNYAVALV